MRISIVGLVIVLLITPSALGKTIHVPGDSSTIQAGINGAEDGDTVLVADGLYIGAGNRNIAFLGKAIVVRSENGPEVTVIDCNRRGRGFYFHEGENLKSKVEGFTIRNGDVLYEGGAGIKCQGSSPAIANCHIINNTASCSEYGGGIYCIDSFPVISGCIITGNELYIEVDFATSRGGGLSCNGGIIRDCIISYNRAFSIGHWGGSVGGGIDCDSATIINCTIYGNNANNGDGISCFTKTQIKNCIIWEDQIAGNPVVLYSDIQGGFPGESNIDEDPLFRDPENGDFHLMATYCGDPYDSPCIDAGDPSILDEVLDCWHGLGTDRSDMGAYGGSNSWWPTAIEEDEESDVPAIPEKYALYQNCPNPFNANTEIRYRTPKQGHVTLKIFNTLGQEVRILVDSDQKVSNYAVTWNGRDNSGREAASGLYFCRLTAGSFSKTIKMVLVR